MITKEGSIFFFKFLDLWAGVLLIGRGHIRHYSEYASSSTVSTYSTLFASVGL